MALARHAHKLRDRLELAGWLHETSRNLAVSTVRTEERRRAREKEAATMQNPDESQDPWGRVAPHLDDALLDLNESDRAVVLLRYFQGKTAREIGEQLRLTEEAAQKRLSRAVEKLRTCFARRGVALTASSLMALLGAGTAQSVPPTLTAGILAAAAPIGKSISLLGTTQLLTMTTMHKAAISLLLAAGIGAGLNEARRGANARAALADLQQEGRRLHEQARQAEQEREQATTLLEQARAEIAGLQAQAREVVTLRGEVARLRAVRPLQADQRNDPFMQSVMSLVQRASELRSHLERMPDKNIPEMAWLTENDWLTAASTADLTSDIGTREALRQLRRLAKERLYPAWQNALTAYTKANHNQLPQDPVELQPFFERPVDVAVLRRYKMVRTGAVKGFSPDDWLIAERAPVDPEYDTRFKMGLGTSTHAATGVNQVTDADYSAASR